MNVSESALTCRQRGFTLVELLVTAAISLLIVAGLSGVIRSTVASRAVLDERIDMTRQASFAMERMVRAVSHSRALQLPLADRAATNWPEHIREQTVPPSPPIGSSVLATAVLAVTLPVYSDLDFDGFPDADNDRDGRIDEDVGTDSNYDFEDGVYLLDDNGNGLVDESFGSTDDDEFAGFSGEDPVNGIDDDGDGSIDEDPPADMNDDGCSGLCDVDDNGNGSIDEGNSSDDDEDGASDEDWYDTVAFYLIGNTLQERTPVPWDETGASGITGRDFVTSDIADQVTRLRFERIEPASGLPLVDITLELTGANGQIVSINRRVRIGGAL
jgi:prepilin-type N-terminal cleavage/methylation domain-containing protein